MAAHDFNKFLSGGSLLVVFLVCPPYSSAAKTQSHAKPTAKPAAATHELSDIQIVEKMRTLKVVDPTFGLSAVKSPDEIVVSTEKNPKFNDKDIKVQAVLIAKTAFGLIPATVQRAKIKFRDQDGVLSQIVVNRTEVDSYGKGELDETKLLDSLELEKGAANELGGRVTKSKVVRGPFEPERQLQLSNIEFLREKGADTKQVDHLFAVQEHNAESGDRAAIAKSLPEIGNLITTQKDLMKNAQDTARLNSQYGNTRGPQSGATSDSGSSNHGHSGAKNGDLIGFLLKNRVNLSVELHDMDVARQQNTNDKIFHKNIRERLLQKLATLPNNIQQQFYEQHPEFTNSPKPSGKSRSKSPVPDYKSFGQGNGNQPVWNGFRGNRRVPYQAPNSQ